MQQVLLSRNFLSAKMLNLRNWALNLPIWTLNDPILKLGILLQSLKTIYLAFVLCDFECPSHAWVAHILKIYVLRLSGQSGIEDSMLLGARFKSSRSPLVLTLIVW